MAMSENRCIGKGNKIPWHVSSDFKWFKEFTYNNTIVVGKNTFDTLPLLKNRVCLVLTKPVENISVYETNQYMVNNNSMTGQIITMNDIESYSQFRKDYLIVAGGAKTYIKLMPYITEFYVTHIKGIYEGDTFMCSFEEMFPIKELIRELEGGHKVIRYSKNF